MKSDFKMSPDHRSFDLVPALRESNSDNGNNNNDKRSSSKVTEEITYQHQQKQKIILRYKNSNTKQTSTTWQHLPQRRNSGEQQSSATGRLTPTADRELKGYYKSWRQRIGISTGSLRNRRTFRWQFAHSHLPSATLGLQQKAQAKAKTKTVH